MLKRIEFFYTSIEFLQEANIFYYKNKQKHTAIQILKHIKYE